MAKGKIENPEISDKKKNWNVVTGCDKYSDGCMNCYAESMLPMLIRTRREPYVTHGFTPTPHYNKINWPLTELANKPKKPAKSFVTDMGDLFHVNVPDRFIFQVFDVMRLGVLRNWKDPNRR